MWFLVNFSVVGLNMRGIDARRLTPARREEILERDGGMCGYCFEDADEVDHIVPWSYRHDDSPENLIAACWLCNHVASNKMFEDLKAKRQYVVERREKILRNTVIAIWLESELSEIGPTLLRDIRSNCIVANDRLAAKSIANRLTAVGLEVRLG